MAHKDITDEQIRDAAYQIWLDEGQPHGRDEAHWQQAFEVLNTPAPKAKAARKPAAKKATPKPKATPKAKAAPKAKAKAAPKKPAK